ncbi:type II toxin-antitoxin system HipA family toxin YjjJ [Steroidobacter agaridevorans]|uniref:type II toxin-antitoxin system HipA family toxin YjjJ n=1 Tax=Steroidobacter agaridevorans TaxID=2695856 RepID=UPI0013207DD8|nr:type II toxin-antitoxin system HipA family toxin YjjJ [Steroidobacter agaridevorans]GFE88690.1 transcriptional regulator [Steroidobacter agaridevorans]
MATAEGLLTILADGASSSSVLAEALGISQPTLSRLINPLVKAERVLKIGSTRGARYALRREVRGAGSNWPLFRIDRTGAAHAVGTLYALAAGQFYLATLSNEDYRPSELSTGLPYFLQDQRPGGFLGRGVPRRYPELSLPQRTTDWTDDHYLLYLTQHGSDPLGDLVLGEPALTEYLATIAQRQPIRNRAQEFPKLLRDAIEGGLPGSSAHGEHPKFAAFVDDGRGPRHVLVKFSPPLTHPIGQRWSDLLVAEHLAHVVLASDGIAACRSQIHRFDDHTYLVVDRFDRLGNDGRLGVTSLFAIDLDHYGQLDNWIAAAARLLNDRMIDAATLEQVRLLATFGALIGNTDRHFGNLSFFDTYDGTFTLTPSYDMLPMLFAPEHNQIIGRTFEAAHPTANTMVCYARARRLAEQYWRTVASDTRISEDFRGISAQCLAALEALPRTGPYSANPSR